MKLRTSARDLRTSLLTAMGVSLLGACGGATSEAGGTGGAGGKSAAGGNTPSGGASVTPIGGGSAGRLASGGSGGTSTGGASTGGSAEGGAEASTGGTGGAVMDAGPDAVAPYPCENPTPRAQGGTGPTGGFVRCANGEVHRPYADRCWSNLGAPDAGVEVPAGPVTVGCHMDADCNARPLGYCFVEMRGFGGSANVSCHYGCLEDADCGDGLICLCGDPVGTCVKASCTTDSSCSEGTGCVEISPSSCFDLPTHFVCGAECTTTADCEQTASIGSTTCVNGKCRSSAVCGRPFLVGGAERRAAIEPRSDWARADRPECGGLDRATREVLSRHYEMMASMEHASVAAFARFTLELLADGAPADLVELSSGAMRDEIEHARLCFGLASAFGGREVGPSGLLLDGALAHSSFADRVRTAFVEACIGETCAALEAAEAAAAATDSAVQLVLDKIALDEARHAKLGFKYVRWALGRLDRCERERLGGELLSLVHGELDRTLPDDPAEGDTTLAEYGVLTEDERLAVRRSALQEAILPCVHTLLAVPGSPSDQRPAELL